MELSRQCCLLQREKGSIAAREGLIRRGDTREAPSHAVRPCAKRDRRGQTLAARGDDLPPVGRLESAAHRSGLCKTGRIRPADPSWPCQLWHRRGRRIARSWPQPRRYDEAGVPLRSEEHTSELQSLMRISYAVFCLKKKKNKNQNIK